jgi:hypothetical protein
MSELSRAKDMVAKIAQAAQNGNQSDVPVAWVPQI